MDNPEKLTTLGTQDTGRRQQSKNTPVCANTKVSQTSALLHIIGGKERTGHRFYTAIVT